MFTRRRAWLFFCPRACPIALHAWVPSRGRSQRTCGIAHGSWWTATLLQRECQPLRRVRRLAWYFTTKATPGQFSASCAVDVSCSRRGCLNLYLSTSSSSYFSAGSFWRPALTDVVGAYRAEDGAFTICRLFVRPSGIPPEALVVRLVSGFEGLVYLDITCAGCRRTWRQLDRVGIQRSLYIIWNSRAAAE